MALAFPTVSNALSLGDIESTSSLNQPFKGRINLLSTSAAEAKSLRVKVASPEIFSRVGIDRPAFLNSIRFRTTVQNGRPVILVSSNQPINEPFLNFLLEVSWPNGQLLKEYTVLLDPPVLMRPNTAIASNTAGVRAEPRAQGRITRPAPQQRRVVRQQPRRVVRAAAPVRRAAPRRAPVRRAAAPVRRVAAAPRITNYRVRRGDTLSKVAAKMGYRGIRKDQMMMALFEKNRRAFSKSNINNLKSGALLKRPSLQEARAVNARTAKSQVLAQARSWKDLKKNTQLAANTKVNKGNDPVASAAKQARLEVVGNKEAVTGSSSQGVATSASIVALKKQLTLANESLTSRFKENEELKSRVTELESLLRKKNRLITLKSQQLSQLQQNLSGGVNPTSSTDAPVVVTENSMTAGAGQEQVAPTSVDAVVNEGTDLQQQLANELSNEQGEIVRDDQGATGLVPDVATATESPFVEDTQSESTDIMGLLGSPVAMGIGGGSLLALLGGLWYLRRRKSTDNEYEEFSSIEIDEGGLNDEPVFEDAGYEDKSSIISGSEFIEQDEDTEMVDEEIIEESVEVIDSQQEDILQEADVYIVYGLHDQAESELKRAIEKEPHNLAYRHKLLENYKAAGDKEAFEKEAKEFMAIDADDKDSFLEDVREWGASLMPNNKLFDGGLIAAGAGVAMVAGTASAITSEQTAETIEDGLENFSLDDVLSSEETYIDPDKVDGVISDAEDTMIELDDDIEPITDISANMESEFEVDGSFEADEEYDIEEDGLDIENITDSLDLSIDEMEQSSIAGVEVGNNEDDEIGIESLLDDELNAFDVSVPDELDLGSDFEVESLSLDLDSEKLDKILPESTAYKSVSKDSLDGYDDDAEDNLLAEFDDNLSFLDLDEDDEVIEETQVDTKLDLAKAYIDMGDIDGARSTLEEVLQDGSDEQKRQAEELLQQTG